MRGAFLQLSICLSLQATAMAETVCMHAPLFINIIILHHPHHTYPSLGLRQQGTNALRQAIRGSSMIALTYLCILHQALAPSISSVLHNNSSLPQLNTSHLRVHLPCTCACCTCNPRPRPAAFAPQHRHLCLVCHAAPSHAPLPDDANRYVVHVRPSPIALRRPSTCSPSLPICLGFLGEIPDKTYP